MQTILEEDILKTFLEWGKRGKRGKRGERGERENLRFLFSLKRQILNENRQARLGWACKVHLPAKILAGKCIEMFAGTTNFTLTENNLFIYQTKRLGGQV
jgi:hypothetical protein